ncbi:AAA domain-containing protein [Azospirillaceae bacterium]
MVVSICENVDLEAKTELETTKSAQTLRIEATITSRLNLAFHQNAAPVLRELTLINDGAAPFHNIELMLDSEPEFLVRRIWRIDAIGPQQRVPILKLDVGLKGAMLGRLTEAETATAIFTAVTSHNKTDDDKTELARLVLPIELLARNQWGGLGHMPEMIAAFIQPNEPAIERLLKKVAEVLRENDKSPALDGYTGNPRRVWDLTSAVWSALGARGLDYVLPPPSFERAGQKVRSPSQIIESGIATCLDLTLLFCAILEHCGLNPLVVCTKGHALAGVWLAQEAFSSPVIDDVATLRKRIKLKELALFETTFVTHRPCPSFTQATEQGARQISESGEHKFELAVDVRRARMQRIRPLAAAEAVSACVSEVETDVSQPIEPTFSEAPSDLPDEIISLETKPEPSTPKGRQERWQRKLLDLSLRNALLNFRVGKRAIAFDAPDPGTLEDILASGKTLRIQPRPKLMENDDPRSLAIHEDRFHEDLRREHARDALMRSEVLADLSPQELDERLTELYRMTRAALQEGGANTLFLAFGFLSWTRDAKDSKNCRAPLILIPVTLQRKSVRSGFSFTLHDDEPRFNLTLLEMLRQDFRLTIPTVEGALPRDDSGLDIAGIWKTVGRAVKDIAGWEVVEDVVLATFSFAKHLMWKDLVDRADQLKKNRVVRHLLETPRDPYNGDASGGGGAFPNPRSLDATYGPDHIFCPLPADSSQLSAVTAAAAGKDFVLIGPPGTGKSQTIANLIAQCLAERKTVLFVSEKIAALDVVYRRLREVGLGEFCLELHSNKARKLDVLGQLQKSWSAKGVGDAAAWRREAQRLKTVRDRLNDFVRRQHSRHRNGLSAFAAVGRVVAGQNLPWLGLSWPSPDIHDEEALDELRELVDGLALSARAIGFVGQSGGENPLALIARDNWSPNWQNDMIKATRALVVVADALEAGANAFQHALRLPEPPLNSRGRKTSADLARVLYFAAGRDRRFLLRSDVLAIVGRLREGLDLLEQRQVLVAQISPPLAETVIDGLRRGLKLLLRRREITEHIAIPLTFDADEVDPPIWEQTRRDAAQALIAAAEEMKKKAINFQNLLGFPEQRFDHGARDGLARLARVLPRAVGRDWRLVLHPSAEKIFEIIRRGIALLERRRALIEQLPSPFTEEEARAFRRGLEFLAAYKQTMESLSTPYYGTVTIEIDAVRLKDDWIKAKQSWGPLRTSRLKKVEKTLTACIIGNCAPDVESDLKQLIVLQNLEKKGIDPLTPILSKICVAWTGASTNPDHAQAVLAFQTALTAALSAQSPTPQSSRESERLSAIADGRYGESFAADCQRLLELQKLNEGIRALSDLSTLTNGLWAGAQSSIEDLNAAFSFRQELTAALSFLTTTSEPSAAFRASLVRLLNNDGSLLKNGTPISEAGEDYLVALARFNATLNTFAIISGLLTSDLEQSVLVDLERYAEIRALDESINALTPFVMEIGPAWAGSTGNPNHAQAVLAFQTARAAAIVAAPWSEAETTAVAEGRCGEVLAADYRRLLDLRQLDEGISSLNNLTALTDGLWSRLKTNREEVEAIFVLQSALSAFIVVAAETPEQLTAIKSALESFLGDGNALLEKGRTIDKICDSYVVATEAYEEALRPFSELTHGSTQDIERIADEHPKITASACRGLLAREHRIKPWCAWVRARGEAQKKGLGPLIAALERGEATADILRQAFETDYCRWWLNATVENDEVLRLFSSTEHEKRIADFRTLDDQFTDLTRSYVRAGLCGALPDQNDVERNSEWGVLRHEMQKKKRHMPLRDLMGRLPTAISKLTPCLLMSPLSIAQFLAPKAALFDVVVFDEASQIPVWDAIGAIARGRQVIMVGDTKQLPPTSFFERAENDDADDVEDDSDLESILDECLGAGLPTLKLSWHYRSRHESLIAFSNSRYYNGELVTFPSPVTEDRGVRFHLVPNGVYEKGGARHNKPEARALVADIVARLKDPEFCALKRTIGVVTFNSEQQRLIEDLLDDERRKYPEIEPFFTEEALEPVFVKSLESVQGDERDIMYFSLVYGPDLSGVVSMNFGPMNRNGGERRLNVAITRARSELRVFSSLRPEQFDLARTSAKGVRDLKHFLEFAERGPRALAEQDWGSVGDYDSVFEEAVATALARKGWQTHSQVGVSKFRIDLGVVNPDTPGRYLAAIECDGATYHRSATARDRDKLREQVLRGLGWDVVRIWSTDWWIDSEGALSKVDARLTALLTQDRAQRAEREERRRKEESTKESVETKSVIEKTDEPLAKRIPSADDLFQGGDLMMSRSVPTIQTLSVATFREANPREAIEIAPNPEAFFDRTYDARLLAMIDHVVTVEGPVHEDVLARRISRAHGWARTGGRIRDRILSLALRRFPTTEENIGLFLWPAGVDTAIYSAFRRASGDEARPIDEIAMPELIALAREVCASGLTGETAISAMAREAGLSKLRATGRSRLEHAYTVFTKI